MTEDSPISKSPAARSGKPRSGFANKATGVMALIGIILAVGVPVICAVLFAQLTWDNGAGYRVLLAALVTGCLALLGLIPGAFLLKEARRVYQYGPRRSGALLILILMLPILAYGIYVLMYWPQWRLYAAGFVVLSTLASLWAIACYAASKRFREPKPGL